MLLQEKPLTHFGVDPCCCDMLRPVIVFLEKFDTSDIFLKIPDMRKKKFDVNIKPSGVYIVSADRLSRFPIRPSPTSPIRIPKDG
jgi:hypothetical protein